MITRNNNHGLLFHFAKFLKKYHKNLYDLSEFVKLKEKRVLEIIFYNTLNIIRMNIETKSIPNFL